MAAVRERLRDPVVWGNAFLLVKAVGAAVIAWVLARSVFGLAQPFLAPWAALLTVHATVYRTLTRGLQQVAAAVLGVLLAVAANAALGVTAASLGAMLLVAMAIGTTRVMRDESTTAAATALVVLLTGYSGDGSMLVERLSDTVIGIAVGLLVNLLIWPRCATAPRRATSTSSTIAWGPCWATWPRTCEPGATRRRPRAGSSGPGSSTRTSPRHGPSSGRPARAGA
jgi:hypothetical protein